MVGWAAEGTCAVNSLERYRLTLAGQPADFLPRVPIVMLFAARHIGSDYAAFAADHRVLVEANARCAEDFGFDQLSCISDPYRETHGFGSTIEYVADAPPRSSHPLEADKDPARLARPDPLASARMLDRVKAARTYRDRFAGRFSIMGWIEGPAAEAADLRDVINFLMDLMDDEPYAESLMDLCTEVGIAFARAQVEAGCDTIGLGDAIASQVSPDVYERLIQPREKRMVKAIQSMGAAVRLHICGNITHLLPGIADLGVDILDVDHMVDLAAARRAVGPRVVLAGNLDPVAAVMRGTPDSIRDGVRRARDAAGLPFMVAAGCEIPAGTPDANLRALCEPLAAGG
jgi:MtaA/CmuA family methyltransferase